MTQRPRSSIPKRLILPALLALALAVGFVVVMIPKAPDLARRDGPATSPATRPTAAPTVASLVPAASDLLIEMGAGDHLVAVSNYDVERPETRGLPRVGDYQDVDWEKMADLRPDVMVVQMSPDKLPVGLRQRADRMGVRLVNVRINRLDDVFVATRTLGDVVNEPAKARAAERALRDRLDAVRLRVAGRPRVRTLVSIDASGVAVAGGGTFVNDVLEIAGGVNVKGEGDNAYPTIDREALAGLDPQAVIQLLPAAAPQVRDEAARVWASMPELSAVRAGRVYPLYEPFVLQPGFRVGETAELFAARLHPDTAVATAPGEP